MSPRSTGSAHRITTTFIALLLILLTFTGGISADDVTTTTRRHPNATSSQSWSSRRTTLSRLMNSVFPTRSQSSSRLQTSWPTVADRTLKRHDGDLFPPTPIPTGHHFPYPPWSSPIPDRRFSSPSIIRVITSAFPSSPPPRTVRSTSPVPPLFSSFWPIITSAPARIAGCKMIHCQVMLANDYEKMLNVSGRSRLVYGRELGSGIARLCRIDTTRISDVSVFEHPETGQMVLKFNINPPVTTCRQGCYINTSQVADTVENLVNSFSFNLSDISLQTLYVDQLPAFYSWSDDGPCPNSTCPDGDVCNVRLSGDFYCQCVTDCATLETDSSNNDLFALFVIPLVVIIILLVLLIVVIYRKRHSIQKKIGHNTVRDYKKTYDVETLTQHPMLATLDPTAAAKLYQALECQLGIAYNERSFDNCTTYSGENLISPHTTMRVKVTDSSSTVASTGAEDSK